jgi:D-glycero-D-manno-heptose 1,7-bisphosphate phosphatase
MGDVAVLYVDLDGTVRKGKTELGRFVNGPEDVEVFPEALVMMRRWKDDGGLIVAVTNQGGPALGLVGVDQVWDAITETRAQCEGLLDAVHVCLHHPDAPVPIDARCWCRKPSAGAIAEAANQLRNRGQIGETYPPHMGLMVGDRPEDEACAEAAGLDFMWAAEWRALAAQPVPVRPAVVGDEAPPDDL